MAMQNYNGKKGGPRSSDWNYGGSKWKLSRSKIDLFTECQRCFYLNNKLGVSRPRGPAFTLNIAVDALLKKEFDTHRVAMTSHPLMDRYGVDAVPFKHKDLEAWRENFVGIQYIHESTGMTISGAVDDVWVNPKSELIIVDYKATSKDGKIESLSDSGWDLQYKRQMEIYQWLFRKKGFKVSPTGYFVYVNGKKDAKAFDGKLEFDITLIAHKGKDAWVDDILIEIKKSLDSDKVPDAGEWCEFCSYRKMAGDVLISQSLKVPPLRQGFEGQASGKLKAEKKDNGKKKINEKKDRDEGEKTDALF